MLVEFQSSRSDVVRRRGPCAGYETCGRPGGLVCSVPAYTRGDEDRLVDYSTESPRFLVKEEFMGTWTTRSGVVCS